MYVAGIDQMLRKANGEGGEYGKYGEKDFGNSGKERERNERNDEEPEKVCEEEKKLDCVQQEKEEQ
jgi:hypothetical protein